MKRILTPFLVFLTGGLAYGALELAYRGNTHLSMLLVGGLCVLCLYIIAIKSDAPIWRKCIAGGVIITTIEFISGIFINIILGLGVWDYTKLRFDLFGQICPRYTLCWILMSIPVVGLLRIINTRVFCKGGAAYDAADRH